MMICKFCREALEEGSKKCKTCGEPFYLIGKLLKFVPLLSIVSIVTTIISLSFAYHEMRGKERANLQKEKAQSEARMAVSQLNTKERAADMVIREISEKLSDTSKNEIIKDLRLPTNVTLDQLEQKAETSPENTNLQRQVFLYRWLKRPERE